MNKKENLDEWLESSSGVKFLRWGELKPDVENPDDFIVIKKGESIRGIIKQIDEQILDGDLKAYKWRVETPNCEEPVIIWSNASMFRQIQDIGVNVGDEFMLVYEKDYKSKTGKTGKDIKLRVKRNA